MKLNLGSGTGPSANDFHALGYVNIDRQTGGEVYPLDCADSCADEVRASHVLEHLPWRQTMDALRDWVRVLKPGGVLKIAVPDFEWIAHQYLAEVDGDAECVPHLTAYLMGGQTDENDYHKAIFDKRGLKHGLELAGLVDVEEWPGDADCSGLAVSLNLQGTKPTLTGNDAPEHVDAPVRVTSEPQELSADSLPPNTIVFNPEEIACVLSVPRLGFMSNMQCLLTVANLGIQIRMQQGAFWGQCLTEAMLQFMEDPKYRYILTVDYDSIFTADDVLNLYRIMASPAGAEIDALTTVQVRRENDSVLLTMQDADGKPRGEVTYEEMQQEAVRVRTAHFGLTLFRVDALLRLPHPWFLDVPDAEGKWGPGKIDCDVSMWISWQATGNSLYLAPRVAIGHLEQVVSWPDRSLKTMHQKIKDFHKVGKPAGAWK